MELVRRKELRDTVFIIMLSSIPVWVSSYQSSNSNISNNTCKMEFDKLEDGKSS